jgi:predicted DNA-binding transcriptional regulator AlpA
LKAELSIPPELATAIAEEVVARLRPILKCLQAMHPKVGDMMAVVELDKKLGGVGSFSRGEEQQGRQRTLPQVGYIRLKEVLAIFPVSKSTWYKGIADGRYPKPSKRLGPRIAAWDVKDIRPLLEKPVA